MRICQVLFEPWGLGDALIAAAICREKPADTALACSSRWHPVIHAALNDEIRLLPADLPYTTRMRDHRFQITNADDHAAARVLSDIDAQEVLSIRGDFRDWIAARKLFPGARIRMNGWVPWCARYSKLVDVPFSLGILKVRNHYQAWAALADVPFKRVLHSYTEREKLAGRDKKITLHVGALSRSKQYPEAKQLQSILSRRGYRVNVVAGPGDPLPGSFSETEVMRLIDRPLVEEFRSAEHVITNDSGSMHLAALLGCRTLALVRTSNIACWIPPNARSLVAPQMPRGYRPDARYVTNEILDGWPKAEAVAEFLLADCV
jgi:hypothetical protein